MNLKGCQGTTGIASALLSGMGEIVTSRFYEWGAGMWMSSIWSVRVFSLYHLSQKGSYNHAHAAQHARQ